MVGEQLIELNFISTYLDLYVICLAPTGKCLTIGFASNKGEQFLENSSP